MVTAPRRRPTSRRLEAGADDYVIKPFKARNESARAGRASDVALQESMARGSRTRAGLATNVKQLRGRVLPMCSYCKKIRVDDKYWQQLEGYLADHSDAESATASAPSASRPVLDGIPTTRCSQDRAP